MHIADELGEVGIFLAENRLVAILKELAVAAMPPVEGDCMAGKEAGHDGVERDAAGLQQEMGMSAEESPGKTRCAGVGEQGAHTLDKTVPVAIVPEDQSPFDATNDDVVEDAGGVETGMAGHDPW